MNCVPQAEEWISVLEVNSDLEVISMKLEDEDWEASMGWNEACMRPEMCGWGSSMLLKGRRK